MPSISVSSTLAFNGNFILDSWLCTPSHSAATPTLHTPLTPHPSLPPPPPPPQTMVAVLNKRARAQAMDEDAPSQRRRREVVEFDNGNGSDFENDSDLESEDSDAEEAPMGRKALLMSIEKKLHGAIEDDDDDEEDEEILDDEDELEFEMDDDQGADQVAEVPKAAFKNKQRVMILASRGITYRHRHLLEDLHALLPQSKKGALFFPQKTTLPRLIANTPNFCIHRVKGRLEDAAFCPQRACVP